MWSVVGRLILGQAAAFAHADPLPRGSADHHDILVPYRQASAPAPASGGRRYWSSPGRRLPWARVPFWYRPWPGTSYRARPDAGNGGAARPAWPAAG